MGTARDAPHAARLYAEFLRATGVPPLRCRRKTFYMPWECGHLRHEYEKCQHVEWLKRHKDEKMRDQATQGH